MAERFGGHYSPDGHKQSDAPEPGNRFKGRKVAQRDLRIALLTIAPVPLIFKALNADPIVMVQYLAALFAIWGAAYMTREGQKAEAAYHVKIIAKPPAIPRKIFGAVLTGVGLGLIGLAGYGVMDAIIYAAVGAGLHLFAFGIDPLRKKGIKGDDFDSERAARAIEKAETTLSEMLEAAKGINDRALEGRVEAMAGEVRAMFRAIEEDPRDLSGAKKFMSVYLKGARDATTKFAKLYAKTRDKTAREEYEKLLTDLEHSFVGQREVMLLDDRTDLDVEIEVLRERLQREGVRARD